MLDWNACQAVLPVGSLAECKKWMNNVAGQSKAFIVQMYLLITRSMTAAHCASASEVQRT